MYDEGMCPSSECSCVQGVYVCTEYCYADVARESDDIILDKDIPSSDNDIESKFKKNKAKDKKGNKSRTDDKEKKGKKGKKGKKSERYRK